MLRRFLLYSTLVLPITLLPGCGGGGGGTQPQTSTVTVSISPLQVSLAVNATQQFTATVTGTFNLAVTWKVNSVTGGSSTTGTVNTTGLYTAPGTVPSPSSVTVTAVSQADVSKTASAIVTLTGSGSPSINQAVQNPPVKLGTTGGNSDDISGRFCCSGTLGALLTRSGTNYVLSNNHVLARSDLAKVGEPVTQPGLVDNNCAPGHLVANLSQFVMLEGTKISNGPPPVYTAPADAAIAQVVSGQVDTTGSILQLGAVVNGVPQPAPPASSTATPTIGMAVAKSGRTTGLTCSTIGAFQMKVDVDYSPSCGSKTTSFTVEYDNQIDILSSTFSNAGDSGSLIVDATTAQPVGLLYAGSPSDTVANPVSDVLTALADPKTGALPTFVGGATHMVFGCTGGSSQGATGQAFTAGTTMRIANEEIDRAVSAKTKRASVMMKDPAIFGVGVTAGDTPGTAAVIILVEQGKPHGPIPAQLDGVPTKVRIVPRIRAFNGSCEQVSERGHSLAGLR